MGKFVRLLLLLVVGLTISAVISVAAQSQHQLYEDDDDFGDFDEGDSDMMQQREQHRAMEEDDGFVEDEESEMEAVVDTAPAAATPPTPPPEQKLVMAEQDDGDMNVESDDHDEFSHLSDEEEFIGYTSESSGSAGAGSRGQHARRETNKEPKITIANVPLHLRSNWDSFYLELMLLAGLLIYFTNFSVGRSKNGRMALAWFEAHKTLLIQQFALVGDDGKAPSESASNGSAPSTTNGSSNPSDKALAQAGGGCTGLQKESENIYSLYCSGRTGVHSMMVELRFIKRQDLVSVVTQVFRPSTDEVVIKLRLEDMDTFVLCMAAKKTANKYIKDMNDITTFCPGERKTGLPVKQYGSSGPLSSRFVVLSELAEASTAVLADQRAIAVLTKHYARINYLHISDQYSGPRQPDQEQQQLAAAANSPKMPEVHKMIILSFQLSSTEGGKNGGSSKESSSNSEGDGSDDMESVRPLTMLVLHLADKLHRMRLSKESKVKAERNRSRVQEAFLKATHAARAERAQEKREEKKRTEREKIMEIDDPEKQRKWEEKENRRAAKRKAPKMKQLKVA